MRLTYLIYFALSSHNCGVQLQLLKNWMVCAALEPKTFLFFNSLMYVSEHVEQDRCRDLLVFAHMSISAKLGVLGVVLLVAGLLIIARYPDDTKTSSTTSQLSGASDSDISSSTRMHDELLDVDVASERVGGSSSHKAHGNTTTYRRARRGPPSPHNKHGIVLLCFFGLVKNIDDEQMYHLKESILRPLHDWGYEVEAVLHSYHASTFTNKFNREAPGHVIDQTAALRKLRATILGRDVDTPGDDGSIDTRFRYVFDVPETSADVFFPMKTYLAAGDPWPFNANESMKYFLRQQYSLLRVTELWSGVPLTPPPVGNLSKLFSPLPQYSGVVYLRPDLYLFSKLNMAAFDAVTAASQEHPLESWLPQWHPWSSALNQTGAAERTLYCSGGRQIVNLQRDGCSGKRMHIAVPTFEWGGLHDRFAFGGASSMFLYGTRGLSMRHYVDVHRRPPHAEKFLKDYLCAAGVAVHLSPMFSGRVRVGGELEEAAQKQAARFLGKRIDAWSRWQKSQYLDRYGRGTMRRCIMMSVWANIPLAEPNSGPVRRVRMKNN